MRRTAGVAAVLLLAGSACAHDGAIRLASPSTTRPVSADPSEEADSPTSVAADSRLIRPPGCPAPLSEQDTSRWGDSDYNDWSSKQGGFDCYGPYGPGQQCGDEFRDEPTGDWIGDCSASGLPGSSNQDLDRTDCKIQAEVLGVDLVGEVYSDMDAYEVTVQFTSHYPEAGRVVHLTFDGGEAGGGVSGEEMLVNGSPVTQNGVQLEATGTLRAVYGVRSPTPPTEVATLFWEGTRHQMHCDPYRYSGS